MNGPAKARFEEIFAQGLRESGPTCRLIALPGTGQLGIATAKKLGSKPRRNHAKRRVREATRHLHLVNPSLDYVVVAGAKTAESPFLALTEELGRLFQRINERWAEQLASS